MSFDDDYYVDVVPAFKPTQTKQPKRQSTPLPNKPVKEKILDLKIKNESRKFYKNQSQNKKEDGEDYGAVIPEGVNGYTNMQLRNGGKRTKKRTRRPTKRRR
jgi:hypothetical protein